MGWTNWLTPYGLRWLEGQLKLWSTHVRCWPNLGIVLNTLATVKAVLHRLKYEGGWRESGREGWGRGEKGEIESLKHGARNIQAIDPRSLSQLGWHDWYIYSSTNNGISYEHIWTARLGVIRLPSRDLHSYTHTRTGSYRMLYMQTCMYVCMYASMYALSWF